MKQYWVYTGKVSFSDAVNSTDFIISSDDIITSFSFASGKKLGQKATMCKKGEKGILWVPFVSLFGS